MTVFRQTIRLASVIFLLFAALISAHALQASSPSPSFVPRIHLRNGTSSNWSGYVVQTSLANPQNASVSNVSGEWVIPALTCPSLNTYSSAWVGIDGNSSKTVEQIGTEHDCSGTQARYYAWYEMYPKPSKFINLTISQGDHMRATVRYTGKNQFTLTLTNLTTNQTFSTVQKANASRNSAEWVVEAPWSGGILPLTNFGTLQFSSASATLNGHSGSISDPAWQNDLITMVNSSGTAKATPSALSSDGSSFLVAWGAN